MTSGLARTWWLCWTTDMAWRRGSSTTGLSTGSQSSAGATAADSATGHLNISSIHFVLCRQPSYTGCLQLLEILEISWNVVSPGQYFFLCPVGLITGLTEPPWSQVLAILPTRNRQLWALVGAHRVLDVLQKLYTLLTYSWEIARKSLEISL